MTDSFDLSLYRLPEDTVLLLDNINTAERLVEEAHRLHPDRIDIYFGVGGRESVMASLVRVRIVDGENVIQWKDPFHAKDDWQSIPLEDVRHVQGHWFK